MAIDLSTLPFNAEGFLTEPTLWTENVAHELARREQVVLTVAHFVVMNYLRQFYFSYNNTPTMRAIIKELKSKAAIIGIDEADVGSATLDALFPAGVLKQGSRLAGLPKPARCL